MTSVVFHDFSSKVPAVLSDAIMADPTLLPDFLETSYLCDALLSTSLSRDIGNTCADPDPGILHVHRPPMAKEHNEGRKIMLQELSKSSRAINQRLDEMAVQMGAIAAELGAVKTQLGAVKTVLDSMKAELKEHSRATKDYMLKDLENEVGAPSSGKTSAASSYCMRRSSFSYRTGMLCADFAVLNTLSVAHGVLLLPRTGKGCSVILGAAIGSEGPAASMSSDKRVDRKS
ncbi:hypothetical protein C8J56DRAFT_895782 [Mycena floridula]|nr:hypothetical protein C8J56DRAFT_895782 [Mycena floridula]